MMCNREDWSISPAASHVASLHALAARNPSPRELPQCAGDSGSWKEASCTNELQCVIYWLCFLDASSLSDPARPPSSICSMCSNYCPAQLCPTFVQFISVQSRAVRAAHHQARIHAAEDEVTCCNRSSLRSRGPSTSAMMARTQAWLQPTPPLQRVLSSALEGASGCRPLRTRVLKLHAELAGSEGTRS